MHVNNKIPMVIPMFSGLGNSAELGKILSDRRVNGKSKMVVTTRSRHGTSGILCNSLVVLLDPENMYITVGTSLLFCKQANIILIVSPRDFYCRGRFLKNDNNKSK